MYKLILVPLDGSSLAETILPHVEELARCFGARVLFLNVVEPVSPAIGMDTSEAPLVLTGLIDTATQASKSYLARLQAEFERKGIVTRTRVELGLAVSVIVETAQAEHADLIAMASHGRTGLSQVFYGSVAAGVLHRVDRPLLIVRAPVERKA
jgi:nucleotide-binding universal stress UspA family protein